MLCLELFKGVFEGFAGLRKQAEQASPRGVPPSNYFLSHFLFKKEST